MASFQTGVHMKAAKLKATTTPSRGAPDQNRQETAREENNRLARRRAQAVKKQKA